MNSNEYSSRTNQNKIYDQIKKSNSIASRFIAEADKVLKMDISNSKIKEAVKHYKDEEFRKRASKVSVEEINKERLGIRVSVLEAAGFRNIYQLYCASAQQLLSIHGIGESNARLIINKTNEICNGLKSGISLNSGTQYSQDMAGVVLETYKFLKLNQLKAQVGSLLGGVLSATRDAYYSGTKTSKVSLHVNQEKRKNAYIDSLYIEKLVTDKVFEILEDAEAICNKIENASRKDAWNDYLSNRETYVNCINKDAVGKVEIEGLEKYKKVQVPPKSKISLSDTEENILNCSFVSTHKVMCMGMLAVVVLIIGGIIISNVSKSIAQKNAAEEADKQAKAAFEASIENPITWVNFTFDNKLNLGIEKTETSFAGYDNYIKEDSSIIVKASLSDSPAGYESEINSCDSVDMIDEDKYGCEVVVGKLTTDSGRYIEKYRIKTYRAYLITAESEDKDAMKYFEQMMDSMKFDSVAEKDDEEAAIKAAKDAEATRKAAEKAAYDALPNYPYEGMDEDEVEDTKLGKADKIEENKPENMAPNRWTTTYKWFDKETGRIIFEAIVYYDYVNSPHELGDTDVYGTVGIAEYYDWFYRDGWFADRIPIVAENVENYDSWKELYEAKKSRFGISDASPNEAKRCWELLK